MKDSRTYNTTQSNQLANYLKYQGPGTPGVDFEVVKAFVNNGANPLVCREDDGNNLFGIASYNKWRSNSWLELINICKAGKVMPDKFTKGLSNYIKGQGPGTPGIDFEVVRAFVDNGANPLVCREDDGNNLFGIASYNKWRSNSWLELINICKAGKVMPDKFTKGLSNYLQYQGPGTPGIDFEVVRAFVDNGANPLVCREGDGKNLFAIASYNKWSNASFLELTSIMNLYKPSPSIPIAQFIQEFDEKFDALSLIIAQYKNKTNNYFKFAQNYKSAFIAGKELLENLSTYRSEYKASKITIDEFRIYCGAIIKTALQTDLAKKHVIYKALVSFLNFIAGLTIVIPITTKITTGRWGLFTKIKTESEKHLLNLADNLGKLTDSENNIPESGPLAPGNSSGPT